MFPIVENLGVWTAIVVVVSVVIIRGLFYYRKKIINYLTR